jgi:tripartite-type tricarboxylate transporter receptor subunit TctC
MILRLLLCALAVSFSARAGAWPTRPITFIVPYPPGGGTDVIARIVQEPLSRQLGQPIVIENRGGAGGSLGTAVAARATDAHTFLFTLSSHTINPVIYKKLPFDTEKDFHAVSVVASLPQLFAVNPSTPYKTFGDLMQFVQTHPGRIDFASVGVGSPSHMAGDVPLLIVSIPAAMSQVRSGRLRPLAVSTSRRTPILPDVPTVAEATGLKDFEVDSWYAVFAPLKTPDEAIQKMHHAIAEAVARPDVKRKLLEQGALGVSSTPEALAAMVHKEIGEWRTVVKRAQIEGE